MKLAIPLVLCGSLAGCTDEQNVGDTVPTPTPVFSAPRWAITLGGTGDDVASSVATDPSGDVIAGGVFEGTVDFGNEALVAPSTGASWLSKRAGADGSEIWTRTLGNETTAEASLIDLGTAADGSIIVAGTYSGDLHFDQQVLHGPTLRAGSDCFLAKYDSAGNLVWFSNLGADSVASCASIAVAADGRIALIGMYEGTLHLPTGTFTGAGDMFLAVFDNAGQLQWGVTAPDSPQHGLSAVAVAMTIEDDVIISGDLDGNMILDGTTLQAQASRSEYAARFTVDGAMLWAHELGPAGVLQEAGPIAVDADGAPVITATKNQQLRDNGVPGIDALDPNGDAMWTDQAVSGSARAAAVTVLPQGTVVTGGNTAGSPIDFGAGDLHGCMFLAAHDHAGGVLDAVVLGNREADCVPTKLASTASGSVVFAGNIDRAVGFGTGTLRFAGGHDAMIVMMDTTP